MVNPAIHSNPLVGDHRFLQVVRNDDFKDAGNCAILPSIGENVRSGSNIGQTGNIPFFRIDFKDRPEYYKTLKSKGIQPQKSDPVQKLYELNL